MKSDIIDIDAAVHLETERAYLVSITGKRSDAQWVPKSLCEWQEGPGDMGRGGWGTLTLSERLATEKGLV